MVTADSKVEIETGTVKVFNGFIKRFEDVNNKGIVLYAKVLTTSSGIVLRPQLFEQHESQDKIIGNYDEVKLPGIKTTTDNEKNFYQILVGDTRYVVHICNVARLTSKRRSGHREVVVMTGDFVSGYQLTAWELTMERKWVNVGGSIDKVVEVAAKSSASASPRKKAPKFLQHRFCALLPNQQIIVEDKTKKLKTNGLNVLLISTYKDAADEMVINFRTFVKDGKLEEVDNSLTPEEKEPTQPPAPPSSPLTY